MKIAIGNDHAGTSYKQAIVSYLEDKGHEVFNAGTDDDSSVDYPDFIHPVATRVENGLADLGIIICGSGNGINMAANSHEGIRSALCWEPEIASLARQHNNANVMALPGRFIDFNLAVEMVRKFFTTEFEAGRHIKRINKIPLN